MGEIEIAQTAASAPVEETAATVPVQEYSIRYFFEWHQEVLKDAFGWSVKNGTSLLTGAAGIAVTVAVCFLFLLVTRKLFIPLLEKKHKNTATELMAISGPLGWAVFWFGASISVDFIPFSAGVHQVFDSCFYVFFILTLVRILQRLLQCTGILMHDRLKRNDPQHYNTNKLLLDLTLSIVRLVVWVYVVIFILQEVFHLKVTALIASAGVVGLGVAFAAKDTIANIFGAFAILGGKVCQVGDWVRAGSTEGIVDQIRFRSIRIRTFDDGRLIDIPNHVIADTQIENFNKRLFWREHFCFGLVYGTTPEQMALAKKILEEIGEDLKDLMDENRPVRFDFMLFDNCSLNLDGYVWFKPSDLFTMRRSRGRFNEEVLKRFNEAGLEIAFPTTTVVMAPSEQK